MHITIREAEASDAERLLSYIRQVGSESDNLLFGAEGLPFTVSDMQTTVTNFHQKVTSVWLVAEREGKLIGSAQLVGNTRNRTSHRAALAISVLKVYWHRGVASQLMQRLIDFASQSGIEQIVLEVRVDNAPAIALYRKFGFVPFGRLPRYFNINGTYYDADYMYCSIAK